MLNTATRYTGTGTGTGTLFSRYRLSELFSNCHDSVILLFFNLFNKPQGDSHMRPLVQWKLEQKHLALARMNILVDADEMPMFLLVYSNHTA